MQKKKVSAIAVKVKDNKIINFNYYIKLMWVRRHKSQQETSALSLFIKFLLKSSEPISKQWEN